MDSYCELEASQSNVQLHSQLKYGDRFDTHCINELSKMSVTERLKFLDVSDKLRADLVNSNFYWGVSLRNMYNDEGPGYAIIEKRLFDVGAHYLKVDLQCSCMHGWYRRVQIVKCKCSAYSEIHWGVSMFNRDPFGPVAFEIGDSTCVNSARGIIDLFRGKCPYLPCRERGVQVINRYKHVWTLREISAFFICNYFSNSKHVVASLLPPKDFEYVDTVGCLRGDWWLY